MTNDPVIQEIHAIRRQLMAQAGGDLHQAIQLAHLAHLARNPNRKIWQGTPRRPAGWVPPVAASALTQAQPSANV